jgi:hypothetical protein
VLLLLLRNKGPSMHKRDEHCSMTNMEIEVHVQGTKTKNKVGILGR